VTLAAAAPPPISVDHLVAMTGRYGLFEHARGRDPRTEHGLCVDDIARELGLLVREPRRTETLDRLTELALEVIDHAVAPTGAVHNRMSPTGAWSDRPATGDWWGRAIAGLGAAARWAPTPTQRARALRAFLRAARNRSAHVRSCAFAVIGAVDVLAIDLEVDLQGASLRGAVDLRLADAAARSMLRDCLARIPRTPIDGWGWSEPRLRYANGALCAAVIAGGDALGDPAIVEDGLAMLAALLRIETSPSGWLSVVGTAGRGPGEPGPLWDQQPIEPAAIADACAVALRVTGDERWARGIDLAWGWFLGRNDAGVPMIDLAAGAGYDGLEPAGRNVNCGAESTIAALGTQQHVIELAAVRA